MRALVKAFNRGWRRGWFKEKLAAARAERAAIQRVIEAGIGYRTATWAVGRGRCSGFTWWYVYERRGRAWRPVSKHALCISAVRTASKLFRSNNANLATEPHATNDDDR